jgi:hypothetical protein
MKAYEAEVLLEDPYVHVACAAVVILSRPLQRTENNQNHGISCYLLLPDWN